MKNEKRNSQSTKWEYDNGDKMTTRDGLYKMVVFLTISVSCVCMYSQASVCVYGNIFHTPLCI